MMYSKTILRRGALVVMAMTLGVTGATQERVLVPTQAPPAVPRSRPSITSSISLRDGDSPLTELATFSGHVDVFVGVIPFVSRSGTSGTFAVTGLPASAEVLRAWLQVTSFDQRQGQLVSATFAGNALGTKPADVEDASDVIVLYCSLFRFEVTPFVTGNGSYSYVATGHANAWGDSLIVVYEHPSLPLRTISILDGAESLFEATTTTQFEGIPAAPGRLILFTEADNASSAEEVRLNGAAVAGPADLFNANKGPYASLVTIPVTAQGGTNVLDVVTSDDWFGLHLAILSVQGVSGVSARLDIKPGACPNPCNRNSHGVLPVALLGSDALDVSQVDLSTLALSRADGTGSGVAPLAGPPGPNSVIEDVGTPLTGEPCDCHVLGGDGVLDLSMKFRTEDVVDLLELGGLPDGTSVELALNGFLLDGTAFHASDCIQLVTPGNGPELFVDASVPGAFIHVSPADVLDDGDGFSPFVRSYPRGSRVHLEAPALVGDRRFAGWMVATNAPAPSGSR